MKYDQPQCKNIPIAESTGGTVSLCPDCGVVHLSLQYFSMRFTPEAFRELAHMVGMAQGRMEILDLPHAPRPEHFDAPSAALGSRKKVH